MGDEQSPRVLGMANIVPIFKKGGKENPGNYRSVYMTSIAGKLLKQIIKQSILKTWEKGMITSSQCGAVKNKSCQTNLIYIFNTIISLVDKGNAVV